MNINQEIRAKALEISVQIKGAYVPFEANKIDAIFRSYLPLAELIELHILGDLKSSPAESAEN